MQLLYFAEEKVILMYLFSLKYNIEKVILTFVKIVKILLKTTTFEGQHYCNGAEIKFSSEGSKTQAGICNQ